jgi:hypothetical protein
MSHKNFLMWIFSTPDHGTTREFRECLLGLNGRRRVFRESLMPGRGREHTLIARFVRETEQASETSCYDCKETKRMNARNWQTVRRPN